MTGELIQLERRRDFKPVPRGSAPGAHGASIVELRIARIARLVLELEELTRQPKNVPSTILDQARAGLEKARRIVPPRGSAAGDLEGAPQPELDDERIERMYRELDQDA